MTTHMTVALLQHELDTRDDGVLKHGKHLPGHDFCALEFESQVRGRKWSDSPITLPDIRPLNDARWSSAQARTTALLPVMVALWDWTMWSRERQIAWASRVAIRTVQEIVSTLPGLPSSVREQCRQVTMLDAARAAAADATLNLACQIWIDAAIQTEGVA